jgi:hypothetical protein
VEEIEGGGGIGLFSAGGFDVSGFEGVIETAYPREGCGGLAIEIQSSRYRKKNTDYSMTQNQERDCTVTIKNTIPNLVLQSFLSWKANSIY